MIRLSKLADYGIVIMTHLARHPERQQATPEIAAATNVPQPMAGKILKVLAKAGLLVSHRGARGGYGLAASADTITVAAIIEALDAAIREGVDDSYQLQQTIRRVIGRWVNKRHRRRPMIVPVVIEA